MDFSSRSVSQCARFPHPEPADFMTPATAHIIIVGDEVLAGEVRDLNGPFLLDALARLGVRVTGMHVVPDALDPVAEAVRRAAADRILISGGIGPTHDDCTRPALARALNRPLAVHPEAAARLAGIFAGVSTAEERAMALLPRGAVLLEAPETRSFGFRVERVLVFPGVPELLRMLFAANAHLLGGRPLYRNEVETRVREGRLAGPLRELAEAWPDVTWGSYPRITPDGWRLRLVVRGGDPERVAAAYRALRTVLDPLENTAR
jgi:molybdenum cofactor synthesis domain-containing protein